MLTDFVEINGANIYYEVAGEGFPVVVVHAGIADSRMWDDQMAAFAAQYKVIRYDARGFGQSDPAEGEFYRHENLRALLKYLNIDKAHLVGCSMGGSTILDFALEYPRIAASLTLVGSGLAGYEGPSSPKPANWDAIVAAFEAGDFVPANEYEIQKWVGGFGRSVEQVPAAVREKVAAMNLIALRNDAAEIGEEQELDPPAITRLGEISVPTLVMIGAVDQPDLVAMADVLANKIPGAKQVIMEDTAHLPSVEHPDAFNRLVLDFLNGLT